MTMRDNTIWRLLWPKSFGWLQVAAALVLSVAFLIMFCSAAARKLASAASSPSQQQRDIDPEDQALLGGRRITSRKFCRMRRIR
jgi:hypothetical protein